jgi:acetyl esterase/lipase
MNIRIICAVLAIGLLAVLFTTQVFSNSSQEWKLGARPVPGPLPPDPNAEIPSLDMKIDVVYGTIGGVELKLDFAKPVLCAGQSVPLIVYFHHGGWRGGDKSGILLGPDASMLYQLGFAVASVDYRLAPQYRFPAQIHDAKLAIRFLRQNASLYGIDPDRIGAWGTSAGAHLSFLLATTNAADGLEGPGLEGVSSRVQAAVGWFGPTDLNDYAQGASADIVQMLTDLLGCSPLICPSTAAAASPVNYVRAGGPPIQIVHGENDDVVPYRQAEIFAERLRAVGNGGSLIKVKNAGHGFSPYPWYAERDPSLEEIYRLLVAHMARSLEPALLGDLDMNGKVENPDLVSLIAHLNTEGFGPAGVPAPVGWNPLADLNVDGRVNGLDVYAYLRLVFRPSFRPFRPF